MQDLLSLPRRPHAGCRFTVSFNDYHKQDVCCFLSFPPLPSAGCRLFTVRRCRVQPAENISFSTPYPPATRPPPYPPATRPPPYPPATRPPPSSHDYHTQCVGSVLSDTAAQPAEQVCLRLKVFSARLEVTGGWKGESLFCMSLRSGLGQVSLCVTCFQRLL